METNGYQIGVIYFSQFFLKSAKKYLLNAERAQRASKTLSEKAAMVSLEVKNYERMTELKVEKRTIRAGELQKSDALIVFSRKNALKYNRRWFKYSHK